MIMIFDLFFIDINVDRNICLNYIGWINQNEPLELLESRLCLLFFPLLWPWPWPLL
mgnify:CR=1